MRITDHVKLVARERLEGEDLTGATGTIIGVSAKNRWLVHLDPMDDPDSPIIEADLYYCEPATNTDVQNFLTNPT